MKKILALLLTVVLSVTFLASCGSKSDLEYIKANKKMIIGMTLFAPMNYKDSNGELTGFETEFAKAVCEKIGVEAKFVEIDWNSKETELNSKNIDCIWNGMTIDDDRKANMDISTPYMQNKQVLVVKAENANKYTDAASLKDAVVVAEKGSAGETVATTDDMFKQAKYTAVDSQAKALMEVKAGTADAALIDYVMTIGSIGEGTDYANVVVVSGKDFAPEEYGVAFRKNSPETLKAVNDAMQALSSDGTLNKIAAKYKLEELILIK